MSDNINITENYKWVNEHNNVLKQVLHRYQISNVEGSGWRKGLEGIQEMLKQARLRKERVRSYGGKWSLSDVAICSDTIHDTKPLTFYGVVSSNSIIGNPFFTDDPKPLDQRLFFFQSGCQINQINIALENRKLCLPTTGASNGQTLAGAISTGTHGSALKIGAMQDYVRAIHIVTNETDHFFIQPASGQIINESFSNVFGAKLITDDKLFYAALVSFGSFGIIHGYIIETVSLYMLETYVMRVDYHKADNIYPFLGGFNHTVSTNLKNYLLQFDMPSDVDPHHVRLIVNPYSTSENTYLEVMYRHPFDETKLTPEAAADTRRVSNDILSTIGSIANVQDNLIPIVVNTFFGKVAKTVWGYTQTPRNLFGDTTIQKPKEGSSSVELGIPIGRAAEAAQLIIKISIQSNFLGVMGIRFVKNSKALLAFTKYAPLTCTIEIPGLNTSNTQSFYQKVFADLDNAKIPFTLHWGQQGDYSPKRLEMMHGDSVKEWVNQRNILLPDPLQRYMFTNDFLKRCGLSEAPVLTGGEVIA